MRNLDKYNLYFAHSSKQASILFHLIGLLLISSFPSVISKLRWCTCNNTITYADGSTFSSNLNRVMDDLVKNAPQTGFNTSSHGQSPNRIYGLLQCTGNISRQDCSICSQRASDFVRKLCASDIAGQVWLDNCFLRYDNSSFFSKLDTEGQYLENANIISTSNRSNFVMTAFNLLSKLIDKACVPANKGFAEGWAAYYSNGTIYGLVQCWGDISIKDCRSCLQFATTKLHDCCSTRQGAHEMLGSCTARYEIYPFFDISRGINTSTSPPASSGSSVASPPTGTAQTRLANGTSPTTSSNVHIISLCVCCIEPTSFIELIVPIF